MADTSLNTLRNRRKMVYWVLGVGLLLLIIANSVAWLYLGRIRGYFISDLQFRMSNLARIVSSTIDAADISDLLPGDENKPQVIFYQQQLFEIGQSNKLQSIYILSPFGDLLVDSRPDFQIGSPRSGPDSLQMQALRRGESFAGNLQSIAGSRFLSAYAPVINFSGQTEAVLVLEARADFFSVIDRFNQGLVIFSLLNGVIILIVGISLFLAMNNMIRLQEKIHQQQHLVQLGEMAASVAHELRNPLGIIKGTNDIIRKKYAQNNDEIFTYIPDELNRLNDLINNFLTFARSREMKIEPVALNDLFEKILLGLHLNDGITVSKQVESNLDGFQSDRAALEQVLLNILNNAVQAVNQQGTIHIEAARKNKYLELRVTDSGKGIDPKIAENIFRPFFTTRETGSGLGLAISKRLIEQLHGQISVNNIKSGGAQVVITLPFAGSKV